MADRRALFREGFQRVSTLVCIDDIYQLARVPGLVKCRNGHKTYRTIRNPAYCLTLCRRETHDSLRRGVELAIS